MLRTQEAALNSFGPDTLAVLCEAICLDAVEVTSATRVSIWFFDARGDMVCKRLLNARDGRFQEGAVIPQSATGAYLDAASQGLASTVTEDAPVISEAGDDVKARLDMLLVDSHNRPTAIFRCERNSGSDDWRQRDITILRSLAQTLAAAIRQHSLRDTTRDALAGLSAGGLADMGSVKQDLTWLRQGGEPSIWLQSIEAAQAFDALALATPPMPGPDADPLFDTDEDEAF